VRMDSGKLFRLAATLLLGTGFAACSSNNVVNPPPPPPTVDAPTGVNASAVSETSIVVTWNQVSGAESYELDRKAGSGSFSTIQTGLTATAYTDNGLTPGTTYAYQVRAVEGTVKSSNSTSASATTLAEGPKVATVTGIPLSRTFYSDTVYTLSGYVKVSNGATLTVQAGTKIIGDTLVPGSSLWILRGSKIMANGTVDAPIVFTSARSAGNRKPGDWGGIIIVGNSLINRTASPIFTEGPVGAAEDYSGGTDFNDSSGNLTYVRVEFAGYDVSNGGGQELNSVSSYAVGRGTTYDYVQSVAGLDDSFEFFGGGPDVRHLVSWESGDDHFDWTEGARTRGQFLFALQTSVIQPVPGTGTTSSDPRGFEGDGCEIDKAGCTFANPPYSQPVWANFTVIGPGAGVFSTTDGNAAVVRRGSGGNFVNGILARWPGVGFSIRDAESKTLLDADSLYIRNVYLVENGANFESPAKNFGFVVGDSASQWNVTEATMGNVFAGVLPTSATTVTESNLNAWLAGGTAAATAGLTSFAGTPLAARTTNYFGGNMEATSYLGAFDPAAGSLWIAGWTRWYRN